MATKAKHPVVSTLNPDAPLFVPAKRVTPVNRPAPVEDFSSEWWRLVQTSPKFRQQWVRDRVPAVEDQKIFEAEIQEIADLDAFLEYQDEMQDLEESFFFDDVDIDAFRTMNGLIQSQSKQRYEPERKPEVPAAVVQSSEERR